MPRALARPRLRPELALLRQWWEPEPRLAVGLLAAAKLAPMLAVAVSEQLSAEALGQLLVRLSALASELAWPAALEWRLGRLSAALSG